MISSEGEDDREVSEEHDRDTGKLERDVRSEELGELKSELVVGSDVNSDALSRSAAISTSCSTSLATVDVMALSSSFSLSDSSLSSSFAAVIA